MSIFINTINKTITPPLHTIILRTIRYPTMGNSKYLKVATIVAILLIIVAALAYAFLFMGGGFFLDTDKMTQRVNGQPVDNQNMEGVIVGGVMTSPEKDLATNLQNANNLQTAISLASILGPLAATKNTGPYTIFIPTDEAFNKLGEDTIEALKRPENEEILTNILGAHVVPGIYTTENLIEGQTLISVNGAELNITKRNGIVFINGVEVETPDIVSSNGVAHTLKALAVTPKTESIIVNE